MKAVFEIDVAKKSDVTKLVEADPYGEAEPEPYHHVSFSRNGYKLKDGITLGEDEKKIFLYFKGPDEFLPFAIKKLGDLAKRCPADVEERVIKKIEDEESSAEVGMGAIFG